MTEGARTVVLVGLMGTGKTTIAKMLASRLGVECLDTDRLIEVRAGSSVREIFRDRGEAAFRTMESEVLAECLGRGHGLVVAAAGGVVTQAANRDILREASARGAATVVWLHARPEVLFARTRKGSHRPLLDEDPEGTLVRLSAERAPLYREVADVIVDVSDRDVDSVVDLLLNAIDDDHRDPAGKDGDHDD